MEEVASEGSLLLDWDGCRSQTRAQLFHTLLLLLLTVLSLLLLMFVHLHGRRYLIRCMFHVLEGVEVEEFLARRRPLMTHLV